MLSEIEFKGPSPGNWYSDAPISDWYGIKLLSGILFDDLDVSR